MIMWLNMCGHGCSWCMCGRAYAHFVVTFVAKWWHFVVVELFDYLWSNVVV